MSSIFSTRTLIGTGIVVITLIGLYILYLLGPLLAPFGSMLRAVLIPFILAMIIAYLLHPLVDWLMKLKLGRTLSILVIYVFIFGGLAVTLWYAVPIFIQQMKEFMEELPQIEHTLSRWFEQLNNQIEQLPTGIHEAIDDIILNFEVTIRQLVENMIITVAEYLGSLLMLFVIPFLVFYLLHDVEVIQKTLYFLTPRKYRKQMIKLWKDIDESLGEYIRGQIIVSVFVGIIAGIGYYFIGLPYTLFVALVAAITNIIPYFGPIIGAIFAIIVALFTDPTLIIWVIAINTVIQLLEGNFIAPHIIGRRLHIHPVFIILVLILGAEAGGLIGLILAVPIFVVLKVIIVNTVLHVRQFKHKPTVDKDEHA